MGRFSNVDQALRGAPSQVREMIGDAKSVQSLPYWSTVRCQFVRSGVGPYVWTLSTTDRKAFAYQQGSDCSVAGFAAGTIATGAETNLQNAGQTLSNADVYVWGLAAELTTDSDPRLAALVFRKTWLELSLNGQESVKLGTLGMFPCGGGLSGTGYSSMKQPATNIAGAQNAGQGAEVSFLANGLPSAGNYGKFPQPYIWRKVGGGKDSNLSITLKTPEAITHSTTDRAAAAGIEPYTSPAATLGLEGTYVDIRFRLVSMSVGDRSINF